MDKTIFDHLHKSQENESPSENILEVKNLVKKYGSFSAVNGISFTVKRGGLFAFLGFWFLCLF